MKECKLSTNDKPFITIELKKIARKKSREYQKRGKTEKYKKLKQMFDSKYKKEATKYLEKTLGDLRQAKPGQAFSTLKRLGAPPGTEDTGFTLPSHENDGLSDQESAELIADHFSSISQQFHPLNVSSLPLHVQEKLKCESTPPVVSEFETYRTIQSAKKPKSGLPTDLPREITREFAPELATPVCKIMNSIVQSGEWPSHWKEEQIVPIPKVPSPECEDDLRPISLTPFFSKVTEHFVVTWLLEFIGDQIDFRQYGGQKGNSITHYIIEFINFILSCQDSNEQIAVLACVVDFQKAFMRQDHNILVTKLSDMGVPPWLLKIVISFLSDRKMSVLYKGKIKH